MVETTRGRGVQGRGRGFDMGSIPVQAPTLERQKEPSVTHVSCKLRPSFSRHGRVRNHMAEKPASRTVAQKPVMSLPTEVVNDEGIRHTVGTPVAENLVFYWGVSRVSLIGKSSA